MCEVRSQEKTLKNKPPKNKYSSQQQKVVNNEKKWTMMNPIFRQMKKLSPVDKTAN